MICYLGVFGHFGHAVGLIGRAARVPVAEPVAVDSTIPIFVAEDAMVSGRWRRIGCRPDLIRLFAEPALYHHPEIDPEDASLLPYGVAEYADGRERRLSKDESAAVFGDDAKRYRYSLTVAELERLVCRSS